MDQRFHRGLHLATARRRDLVVRDLHRPRLHLRQALPDHRHAFTHLADAHQVAVIAVAVAADRDAEIEPVVHLVRLRLAQIPRHAGGPQARPGEAPGQRLLRRHDADIHQPLLPDAVVGQQRLQVVDELRESLGPGTDLLLQPGRQILGDAAWPEIIRMQPRAGRGLMELHQLLALLEPPQRRRDRPHVQRIGRHVQQVVQNPGDLAEQRADPARPLGHLDAEQPLGGQREGMLLAHRAHVIEPVEIRQCLDVALVFDQLLGAAMQQPDMRIGALHHLAVHLQDQPQHAMRRRMLWPEIDGVAVDLDRLGHRIGLHRLAHGVLPFRAFSSPGSEVIASHGDRKSKLRKSCVSLTFS